MATRTHTGLALALGLGLGGALGLAGCDGASPSSGLTSYLRLTAVGAQFAPGAIDTMDHGSTAPTLALTMKNSRVAPGATRSLSASAGGTATAIQLGLVGDSGHWIIPVGGVPDFTVDGNVLGSATMSFSSELPLGETQIAGRAVDDMGDLGPAAGIALTIASPAPLGALVIELDWDTEADLDLHLHVTPSDTTMKPFDVWPKAPLALPAGGRTADQVAAAGHLLFDSNARCVIDGNRVEQIVFDKSYPAGAYEVRVDTFSLCSEATARWHVFAYRNPTGTPATFIEAYGQSIDSDTMGDHTATSGLFALSFTP